MINKIEFGSIVLFKDIVLDGKYKNLDHESVNGRPCVLINIDMNEEIYYFIPLSSKLDTINHQNKKCVIYPTKLNKLKKVSYPRIHTIIKKHQCFYDACGFLSDEELYYIYVNIVKYFKTYDHDSDIELIVEQSKRYIEEYYTSHVNEKAKTLRIR